MTKFLLAVLLSLSFAVPAFAECKDEFAETSLVKLLQETPSKKYGVYNKATDPAVFASVVKDIQDSGTIFDVPKQVDTIYLIPAKTQEGADATYVYFYISGCLAYFKMSTSLRFVPN